MQMNSFSGIYSPKRWTKFVVAIIMEKANQMFKNALVGGEKSVVWGW